MEILSLQLEFTIEARKLKVVHLILWIFQFPIRDGVDTN